MISVLTNKHVIVAMIVAPILAIIAYFGVDHYVSEKPHQAVKGASYPLVGKSNCRYESGKCTLKNGDIEIHITTETVGATATNVLLESNIALQGAKIAFSSEGKNNPPTNMTKSNPEDTKWLASISSDQLDNTQLQLAVSIEDSTYFGEVTTVFVDYKTSFSQKNFK